MKRILLAALRCTAPGAAVRGRTGRVRHGVAFGIEIKHHRQPHAIQVLGTSADGYSLDLRDAAKFATDNPKVAAVEGGWVKPVGNGSAKITVTAEGRRSRCR